MNITNNSVVIKKALKQKASVQSVDMVKGLDDKVNMILLKVKTTQAVQWDHLT